MRCYEPVFCDNEIVHLSFCQAQVGMMNLGAAESLRQQVNHGKKIGWVRYERSRLEVVGWSMMGAKKNQGIESSRDFVTFKVCS